MLYGLPYMKDDKFAECIGHIKNAFYPEKVYKKGKNSKNNKCYYTLLPDWRANELPESPDKMIEQIQKSIEKMTDIIKDGGFYIAENYQRKNNKKLPLPFLGKFHKFFLKRKWDEPYRDPQVCLDDLFSMSPISLRSSIIANMKKIPNFSMNYGNFNHFINVVAAMARLIEYFSYKDNLDNFQNLFSESIRMQHPAFKYSKNEIKEIIKLLKMPNGDELRELNKKTDGNKNEPQSGKIQDENKDCNRNSKLDGNKNEHDGMRTFKLLLAAFYHDIGKTIVNHRHGMEGANILADNSSIALYQIDQIVKAYSDNYRFTRDDLQHISDLLLYHDQYGTLSTGETGYLKLPDMISRIEMYKNGQEGKRRLVDLWLLNIADIIVSLEVKLKDQTDSIWNKREKAMEKITEFFSEKKYFKASNMIWDLIVTFKICNRNKEDRFEYASNQSKDYTVERLRRLIYESLFTEIREYLSPKEKETLEDELKKDIGTDLRKKIKDELQRKTVHPLKEEIMEMLKNNIDTIGSIIIRAISANVDFSEFCNRFSRIGQMDYALGFFTKISKKALEAVKIELDSPKDKVLPTRWIRYSSTPNNLDNDPDFVNKNNALYFLDNYITTVVHIINHLLFRESSNARLNNIEFVDATLRLTDEKLSKIIWQEGPYRATRAIDLVLQTVFIY